MIRPESVSVPSRRRCLSQTWTTVRSADVAHQGRSGGEAHQFSAHVRWMLGCHPGLACVRLGSSASAHRSVLTACQHGHPAADQTLGLSPVGFRLRADVGLGTLGVMGIDLNGVGNSQGRW
jgi:hypothetical protein